MKLSLSALADHWRKTRRGDTPAVSVIIPTYNCEAYLARAIDSALGQEAVATEVLVVDDVSTDETQALLRSRYGGNFSVRALRHEVNRGQGAARNTALEVARGKYVFFLDADDWIEPDTLRHLTSLAEGSDAEIVACGARFAFADGRVEPYHAHSFACRGGREALRELIAFRIGSIVWNKLYLRSFLDAHRLRFVDSRGKEDVIFTTEAVYACRRYLSVGDFHCNYFQRDDSCIQTTPTIHHLESFIHLYVDITRFVERHRLDTDPEGVEIARGLFQAHCSTDLFPKLVTYVGSRPRAQWESECWAVCHDLLGTGGYAVADVLIRTMRDSRSVAALDASPGSTGQRGGERA